jgi:ketosteroid isomerase-like protein
MNSLARPIATGASVLLLLLSTLSLGCERGRPQTSVLDAEQVDGEVRTLLGRWTTAFEARALEDVRSVLTADRDFVWLEDGEARYRNVDEILKALAALPPDLKFTHELGDVRIVPMSQDAAWAQVATTTSIAHGGRVVSNFTSVVLMVVRRDAAGWRIHAAHTSTSKPRSAGPG